MSNKLNPLQVRSYKIEYETTDITIEQMKLKYKLPDSLDTSTWHKEVPPPPALTVLTEPPETAPPPAESPDTSSLGNGPGVERMLSDIHEFKELTVARALSFMKNDGEWAEIKEIKDMVAIVDSIEKSVRPQVPESPAGITVQVLVQNLMSEFKRDC